MSDPSKSKSATELLAELQKDPEYVARMKQLEERQRANVENYSRIAPFRSLGKTHGRARADRGIPKVRRRRLSVGSRKWSRSRSG